MPIYLDETRNSLSPLTDYQSGFGEYFTAKGVGSFMDSPTAMAGQVAAVKDAELGTNMLEQMFDNSISSAEFGMKYAGQAPRQVTMMPAEEARAKIKESGVKLTVPDSGISADALDLMIKNQQRKIAENSIVERSPTGLRSVAGFGAAFAGSLLDPLNVATGLVPIIGEARYTSLLAQSAGSFAGRTAIRAGVGFAEGVVGAAAIEPMMMSFNKQLQNDYTMTDSLLNVAFGGVFGGGLHTIGGGFGEGLRNLGGKAHPWEAYRGLSMSDAMSVMKFQNDLMAGKVEDVGTATAGWSDRMREAAGIKGGELPPQVREAGFQPTEAPEAPFARLYETTPESARALALNDLRDTIRADLLATAGNRAENGDIANLRQQLADTQSKLASLNEADFKRRAKEAQQQGMSRKEAEAAARKQVNDELANLEATKKAIEQQIDTNAKASQADQQIAALDKGEVPPAYEAMVQARADKIMAGADMARATLQMDQLPAPFVIGMASPQTRQVALSTAVAHMAQGQTVNIEPVFHIDAGKMTPEQVLAAAKRQQQPSASGVADEAASTQANERVARSDKKDANLEAATKAADDAVERLNAAIKNLEDSGASPDMIESLRKQAADIAKYSRGQSAGSTAAEIATSMRESFDGSGGRLVDSGALKIVQSVSELPPRADGQPHPADTKGMFDGSTGYIVADNVTPDQAAAVLLHEAGVHFGMRQMLGEGLFRKLTKEVEKRAAAGEEGFVDGLKQVPSDTPDKDVAEEIMAYLVENRPELPLVKRIISAIKAFIYRVTGGNFVTLSPDDIRQMAVAALKKVSSAEYLEKNNGSGNGRTGYTSRELAPLDGAPAIQGATGPDPRLVDVARSYAAANGIQLGRQSSWAKVDEARARRLAQAYDEMKHDPQNPKVKEAYENLIRQAVDQYRALEAAGYKFFFFDDTNDPYAGNPWNAMRDLRKNQRMGVYASEAGFGSGATSIDVANNPLLGETGLMWPYGSPDGQPKRVLANDVFRAVHDAFGHGLEGAGFRAEGEENAWQAHAKLFHGSALGALTSETRGQNSWLNYGPYGERNRTASVEDTVFADQKTGLMPEWTWREGLVSDVKYARGSSVDYRTGKESLKKFGLYPNERYNTREIAAAMEARQRAKVGTIARDDFSDETAKKIGKWMTEEVQFAVDQQAHGADAGVGWYSEKYQRALDSFGEVFPELKTDKTRRDFFTALVAIMSDGQKVFNNFTYAAKMYEEFKTTGLLPTDITFGGERSTSMNVNMHAINDLLAKFGGGDVAMQKMADFLQQEFTVSQLSKIAKESGVSFSSAYKADTKLPMAALVFGPKLGAFYANLMGSHGYLTMDRWWSRTFNRYRGQLLTDVVGRADNPVNTKGEKIGLARFKEMIGEPNLSDEAALTRLEDYKNSYEAKGYKDGTPIEKAANTLYKDAFVNMEDAPFNASDREFMIRSVTNAQKMLKRKGIDLSIADIQAVLWYYEKRLYGELGARQSADVSYEEAAKRVVDTHRGSSGGWTASDNAEPTVLGPNGNPVEVGGIEPTAVNAKLAADKLADAEAQAALIQDVKAVNDNFDNGVKDAQGLGEAVNAAAVCGLRN